ncbi:hypothetical protein EVAR_64336_1 [Eumeta japonica]|uniref:Uncharacterized protein n=1 Tax=Eumeta variegata TaxID=151549 RepID=A0A4C1ZEH8_EUMVA|nr:hypothetical protein EVAR_64336_1 [Eumeta japonica]
MIFSPYTGNSRYRRLCSRALCTSLVIVQLVSQAVMVIEPDAQMQVGGKHSCHLMMKSAANFLKKEGIDYIAWDVGEEVAKINFNEKLKYYLEYKYTNGSIKKYCYSPLDGCIWHFCRYRFGWNRAALLYESESYSEVVGASGGWLLASTIHDYFIFNRISVLGREILATHTYEEILLETVGYDFASESGFNSVAFRRQMVPFRRLSTWVRSSERFALATRAARFRTFGSQSPGAIEKGIFPIFL